MRPRLLRAAALLGLLGLCLLGASACAASANRIPVGTTDPDKLLFERGTQALADQRWMTAREYFQQIVDGYPQSSVRADAKLGVGDAYLGEKSPASLVLALNEYREFLIFYPTSPRADYAQFKIAMSHSLQMARPERDQTETREAIKEFNVLFDRYPNSSLIPEARQRFREARDRLSESEFRVGLFYFRSQWYPGAIDRLRSVLKSDPEYTGRDAVYFYLAESLNRIKVAAEALVYYERLVAEFETSEYLEEARLRIAELKAAAPKSD